jgi:hypothetical protein
LCYFSQDRRTTTIREAANDDDPHFEQHLLGPDRAADRPLGGTPSL